MSLKSTLALLTGMTVLSLAWSEPASSYKVYGEIVKKYAELGGGAGPLGEPTSDEADALYGGRFNKFTNGYIYWHPDVGTGAVWGEIAKKWDQLGREKFAYPEGHETSHAGRARRSQFKAVHLPGRPTFFIYWTPQTGAHVIYGAIHDKWERGWLQNPLPVASVRLELGYPTSDEFQDGEYRRSNFEYGYIRWSNRGGAEVFVTGAVGPQTNPGGGTPAPEAPKPIPRMGHIRPKQVPPTPEAQNPVPRMGHIKPKQVPPAPEVPPTQSTDSGQPGLPAGPPAPGMPPKQSTDPDQPDLPAGPPAGGSATAPQSTELFVRSLTAKSSCEQLWVGRNQIFKDAGYCFTTPKAIARFGNEGCQFTNQNDVPLSPEARSLLSYVRTIEATKGGC